MVKNFLQKSIIVLFIFDHSDIDSFEYIKEAIEEYQNYIQDSATVQLIGNKNDLSKVVSNEDIQELSEKYNMDFHSISSNNNADVNSLFSQLGSIILNKIETGIIQLPSLKDSEIAQRTSFLPVSRMSYIGGNDLQQENLNLKKKIIAFSELKKKFEYLSKQKQQLTTDIQQKESELNLFKNLIQQCIDVANNEQRELIKNRIIKTPHLAEYIKGNLDLYNEEEFQKEKGKKIQGFINVFNNNLVKTQKMGFQRIRQCQFIVNQSIFDENQREINQLKAKINEQLLEFQQKQNQSLKEIMKKQEENNQKDIEISKLNQNIQEQTFQNQALQKKIQDIQNDFKTQLLQSQNEGSNEEQNLLQKLDSIFQIKFEQQNDNLSYNFNNFQQEMSKIQKKQDEAEIKYQNNLNEIKMKIQKIIQQDNIDIFEGIAIIQSKFEVFQEEKVQEQVLEKLSQSFLKVQQSLDQNFDQLKEFVDEKHQQNGSVIQEQQKDIQILKNIFEDKQYQSEISQQRESNKLIQQEKQKIIDLTTQLKQQKQEYSTLKNEYEVFREQSKKILLNQSNTNVKTSCQVCLKKDQIIQNNQEEIQTMKHDLQTVIQSAQKRQDEIKNLKEMLIESEEKLKDNQNQLLQTPEKSQIANQKNRIQNQSDIVQIMKYILKSKEIQLFVMQKVLSKDQEQSLNIELKDLKQKEVYLFKKLLSKIQN